MKKAHVGMWDAHKLGQKLHDSVKKGSLLAHHGA